MLTIYSDWPRSVLSVTDDALSERYLKFTAYRCGYASDRGKGVIPGPVMDTRFLRFSDG